MKTRQRTPKQLIHKITHAVLAAFVWLIQALIGLAVIVFFGMLVADWLAGCGETYIDSKGNHHPNECIFFNFKNGEKK
jgi:hypothetical protein